MGAGGIARAGSRWYEVSGQRAAPAVSIKKIANRMESNQGRGVT